MSDFEELKALEDTAEKITALKQQRKEEVVKALLAGHSQRAIAVAGSIAVNTVRSIMDDEQIVHSGEKYSFAEKKSA